MRIPSAAGDPGALRRMALAVAEACGRLGAEVQRAPLDLEPPLVVARIDAGAPTTVLLYNMYDVMPADARGWRVPPFEGGVADLPGIGPSFVARGAENNKGPLAAMLGALAAMLRASGSLPVNVEILIEGEEESGSRGLRAFLAGEPSRLRPCRAALFPSLCEYGGGPPRVFLGFKGIVHGTLRAAGGPWGGPTAPIHGSNAPWIANPAWRLVQALAALAAPPTGDFDAGAGAERLAADPLVAALAARFDFARELEARHASRFAADEPPAARLARLLGRSALNVSALEAGESSARSAIPASASARFDLRLAEGLTPEAALAAMRERLARGGAEGVGLEVDDAYPAVRFGLDAPGVAALLATYRDLGADPEVWPIAAGAAPAYAFGRLAASFLIGGLGRGGNAHGVDEFVTLEGLRRCARSLCLWLHHLAADEPGQPGDRP